jgi:alkaline phosphatase
MKRRELIRAGVLAGAAGMAGVKPVGGSVPFPLPPSSRARNVILLAYDGLTWEDVGAAQFHSRRLRNRPLTLARLLRERRGGSMETYSLNSVVTDSAAAASAWGSGRKGVNAMINMYPDGTRLTPVLEIARGEGRATGLVTTTRVTHATPAGWLARVDSRNDEDEIADQYLAFGPDVLLGGGARHFDPQRRRDGRDVAAEFAQAGYGVVRDPSALERSNASRLLGLFTDDHLPFELDRQRQGVAAPSLAEMTRKALDLLDGHRRGFVLQVEAGRVDHANHKSDAAAALHDIFAADTTLALLLDWVDARPDTLLIVASDHGTGGGAAYGTGPQYRNSSVALERLDRHDASFDHILGRLRREGPDGAVGDIVREHTGVELDAEQVAVLRAVLEQARSSVNRVAFQEQPFNTLGHLVYGGGTALHADRVNVSFATGQHTAGPVPVAAYGRGAAELETAFVDNTVLFDWVLAALGTTFSNPVMSEEAARELLQGTASLEPAAGVVHT